MKTSVPLCLVLAGCSFDASTIAFSDSGIVPEDGRVDLPDAASLPPSQFSGDFEIWLLPDSGTNNGFNSARATTGPEQWTLIDIDGDDRLELVQTADPETMGGVWGESSAPSWKVFSSEEGGFIVPAKNYSVPDLPVTGGYLSATRQNFWTLWDLDSDGWLDLVQFVDPSTGDVWLDASGLSWRYYRGGQNGFGSPVRWRLPELYSLPLNSVATCFSVGCWRVLDLTGDGRDDLVHSSDPAPLSAFDSPEDPAWHVYENDGSGFNSNFSRWSLPATGRDAGFYGTDWLTFSETTDIDQDGKFELLQTQRYPSGGLEFEEGQPFWRVFRAEESGFQVVAEQWSVPVIGLAGGLNTTSMNNANAQWTTVDLNNDGHLDLVLTADIAEGTPTVWGTPSSAYWKVYWGTGVGFEMTAALWPVPNSTIEDGFYAAHLSEGTRQWSLLDLEGDGWLELVQMKDPSTNQIWRTTEGSPFWRVYRSVP